MAEGLTAFFSALSDHLLIACAYSAESGVTTLEPLREAFKEETFGTFTAILPMNAEKKSREMDIRWISNIRFRLS